MKDCLFCKIFKGEIPAKRVFENEQVIAFQDLHPMAPIHLLFIHKEHSENLNEMMKDSTTVQELFGAITEYTKKENLVENGYRVVTNVGPHGGQSVFHTHFHVLAGAKLRGFGA